MQVKKVAIDFSHINVLKDYVATAPKIFVPLPKFEYVGPNEFKNVPTSPPYTLAPDLQHKVARHANMPIKHPAFSVVLDFVVPKLFGEMSMLDWGWHKEVLRRSRVREEAHRVVQRVEMEDLMRELSELQANKQLDFLHAAWEKRAINANVKQKERIAIGRKETQEFVHHLNDMRLAIRDKRAQKEFLRQYLQVFSPTNMALHERIHRARTEPTLAEIRMEQDREITPYEVLLAAAQKRLPLLKKMEIHEALQSIQHHVNQIKIDTGNVVAFKRKLTQMFNENFLMRHGEGVIARQIETKQLFELKDYRNFHVEKSIASRARAKEHLMGYLDRLHLERKLFGAFLDHVKFERKIDDVYNEAFDRKQKAKRRERVYLPLVIEGKTGFVQIYSQRVKTQYTIIKQWVDTIQQLMHRRETALAENILKQRLHNKDVMRELSDFVTKDAHRLERMRNAMNMHDYFKKHDLQDTLAAFLMHAENTKKLIAPTTNQILDKKGMSQQIYNAVSPTEKTASFKRIA